MTIIDAMLLATFLLAVFCVGMWGQKCAYFWKSGTSLGRAMCAMMFSQAFTCCVFTAFCYISLRRAWGMTNPFVPVVMEMACLLLSTYATIVLSREISNVSDGSDCTDGGQCGDDRIG